MYLAKIKQVTLLKTDKTEKFVTGKIINILGEVILTITLNGVTKKTESLRTKNFGQLVRNKLDRKIQSMGLPNEYILSQNKKHNVQFSKSQKGTQTTISPGFFLAALGNVLN